MLVEKTIEDHVSFCHHSLESQPEVKISSLIESYLRLNSSLHAKANNPRTIDAAALGYALDRLPKEIFSVRKVFLGQRVEDFRQFGCQENFCQEIATRGRRRKQFFDPANGNLFIIMASVSDFDDVINILIAFQIERNKLFRLLNRRTDLLTEKENFSALGIEEKEWQKLKGKLGDDWHKNIAALAEEIDITVCLLSHQKAIYQEIALEWFTEVRNKSLTTLESQPIYFVSSNLHSLLNTTAGFPAKKQVEIFEHINVNHPDLWQEFLKIKEGENVLRINDYLYYISKIYFEETPQVTLERNLYETELGIVKISATLRLACNTQVIPVSAIAKSQFLDPNLRISDRNKLLNSNALILNIDYPLGMAGYFLLKTLLKNLKVLRGIYVVGKAAILTGNVGDTQIPKIVFDERTKTTFTFKNVFNENFPFKAFQSEVWKEEESVSVYGTFLENHSQLETYVNAGFNVIEMESGPYLKAIAEAVNNQEIADGSSVDLSNPPFDLGIINYASDNPLSEKNLGAGSLALKGIEPTYLALLGIIQRIIEKEESSPER